MAADEVGLVVAGGVVDDRPALPVDGLAVLGDRLAVRCGQEVVAVAAAVAAGPRVGVAADGGVLADRDDGAAVALVGLVGGHHVDDGDHTDGREQKEEQREADREEALLAQSGHQPAQRVGVALDHGFGALGRHRHQGGGDPAGDAGHQAQQDHAEQAHHERAPDDDEPGYRVGVGAVPRVRVVRGGRLDPDDQPEPQRTGQYRQLPQCSEFASQAHQPQQPQPVHVLVCAEHGHHRRGTDTHRRHISTPVAATNCERINRYTARI